MISGVTVDVGERRETLRFTTRAMMAAEQRLDMGLLEIARSLEGSVRVGTIVTVLSECANDGKGIETEAAQAMVDEIGLARAAEVLGEVVEAAFPEASGKNPKRAGQKP